MPGVHVSALQALRDVADDVSVSKAIAKAGGLKVRGALRRSVSGHVPIFASCLLSS